MSDACLADRRLVQPIALRCPGTLCPMRPLECPLRDGPADEESADGGQLARIDVHVLETVKTAHCVSDACPHLVLANGYAGMLQIMHVVLLFRIRAVIVRRVVAEDARTVLVVLVRVAAVEAGKGGTRRRLVLFVAV